MLSNPKYIINNIKTIAYKLKEYGRENANTRFYSGSVIITLEGGRVNRVMVFFLQI